VLSSEPSHQTRQIPPPPPGPRVELICPEVGDACRVRLLTPQAKVIARSASSAPPFATGEVEKPRPNADSLGLWSSSPAGASKV
jgi:hypothetical protein